jgi:hypothetical protein
VECAACKLVTDALRLAAIAGMNADHIEYYATREGD